MEKQHETNVLQSNVENLTAASDETLQAIPSHLITRLIYRLLNIPDIPLCTRYILVNEAKDLICDEEARLFTDLSDLAQTRNGYADDNNNKEIHIWKAIQLDTAYLESLYERATLESIE